MRNILLCLGLALSMVTVVNAQRSYVTFPNDPLKLKKTTLENGLTVFLIEDHNKPEIFGGVAVKAGGKTDPADATGMAHYLEHMLFKGTTSLGTVDFEQEKKYLDQVDALYEELGKTNDEEKRKEIQLKINENSIKATEFAVPNEFSNLVNYMGGTNLNAFTTWDWIFFFNEFPANQTERFLDLYAHRFDEPVFRLFQSELETVYEEKNQRSESFQWALFETLLRNAFKNHPYGTQPVIGTTEHLKTPSLTKMYAYFNEYFVANNMALILSGDFDSDEIMPIVEKKFGGMRQGKIKAFPSFEEEPFNGREVVEINITPVPMGILGFRTVPAGHPDEAALEVTNHLLFNSAGTGLFNKAAVDQELMVAAMIPFPVFDHGLSVVFFLPKTGEQSVEEAEKVVLEKMAQVKGGQIDDNALMSSKMHLKKDLLSQLEDLNSRAIYVGNTFASNRSWEEIVNKPAEYDRVTKERVIEVAKKYYGEDYLLILSRVGAPTREKLDKPAYEPPIPKRDAESDYARAFKKLPEGSPKARFVQFDKDMRSGEIGDHVKIYRVANPLNSIFEMKMRFGMGRNAEPFADAAAQYMNLAGTKDKTNAELRSELSSLGCTYNFSSDENAIVLTLDGYDKNLAAALSQLKALVLKPSLEDEQVKSVARGMMAQRQQEYANPQVIGEALYDYARYGENSPWLTRPAFGKVQGKKAKDLTKIFATALSYDTEVHYSGRLTINELKPILTANFFDKVKPKNAANWTELETKSYAEPIVYFVERKDANQTQLYFYKEGTEWNPDKSVLASAFTRYFGKGFSALVLQEIREYRSLAYNARASIKLPGKEGGKMQFFGFVSTQTDKTNDALKIMVDLIKDMPQKKNRMDLIRQAMTQNAYSSRPGFRNLSEWVINQKRRGFDRDPYQVYLPKYQTLNWDMMYDFYSTEVQSDERPLIIAVTGPSESIDMDALSKLGKVQKLSESDIMRN